MYKHHYINIAISVVFILLYVFLIFFIFKFIKIPCEKELIFDEGIVTVKKIIRYPIKYTNPNRYYSVVKVLKIRIQNHDSNYITTLNAFINNSKQLKVGDYVKIWSEKDKMDRGFYRIWRLQKESTILMKIDLMVFHQYRFIIIFSILISSPFAVFIFEKIVNANKNDIYLR